MDWHRCSTSGGFSRAPGSDVIIVQGGDKDGGMDSLSTAVTLVWLDHLWIDCWEILHHTINGHLIMTEPEMTQWAIQILIFWILHPSDMLPKCVQVVLYNLARVRPDKGFWHNTRVKEIARILDDGAPWSTGLLEATCKLCLAH